MFFFCGFHKTFSDHITAKVDKISKRLELAKKMVKRGIVAVSPCKQKFQAGFAALFASVFIHIKKWDILQPSINASRRYVSDYHRRYVSDYHLDYGDMPDGGIRSTAESVSVTNVDQQVFILF